MLREHCAREGRPYGEIEKTITRRVPDEAPVGQIVDEFGEVAALGFDKVIFSLAGTRDPQAAIDVLGKVVERADTLATAGR
ncbi:hypothetical protein [Streptomyces sp. NBC_01262]|uniref:hypothetical protein n=1 Tax=Streptomyces sp. NBC_01262 TaxID=2903803 RepID=UPI003FCE70D7